MVGRAHEVGECHHTRLRGDGGITWESGGSPGRQELRGGGAAGLALALGAVYAVFTDSHRGGSGTPLVCLHGFMDTWRSWELVLPVLERHHDVLAPTFPGHAGGPPLEGAFNDDLLPDAIERAMDDVGFRRAHLVGNSLGGFVALQLAARGRAESVVALAPAGGWAQRDESLRELLSFQSRIHAQARANALHAEKIVASAQGRRRATELTVTHYEHIPAQLIAHQIAGVASCHGADAMIRYAADAGYRVRADRVDCPVRMVWGTADKLLPWPSAAARFRHEWFPHADWIELADVGHCPQLDVPLETAHLIIGFTTS
jgi:pimeloyl-ACP methyl ester carboxylesterase